MVTALRKTLCFLALGLPFVPGCDPSDTVGPEGGIVTSRDGRVVLEIPEGSLSKDVEVTIERVDDGPDGAVGFTYEIEPRLTNLQRPARLTYDLAAQTDGTESLGLVDSDVADATLVTEQADGWGALADLDVDEEAGLVSASVLYFSSYALVLGP